MEMRRDSVRFREGLSALDARIRVNVVSSLASVMSRGALGVHEETHLLRMSPTSSSLVLYGRKFLVYYVLRLYG